MADADVDALAREIFDWYLEHEPVFATHMGIHEYDHLMPDGRLKAKLDEIKAGKAFKDGADAISPEGLSIARTLDPAPRVVRGGRGGPRGGPPPPRGLPPPPRGLGTYEAIRGRVRALAPEGR